MSESVKNYNYVCIEDCIVNKRNLNLNATFKVFQWNVRGMNTLEKFDAVKEFLHRYDDCIDILVLGETWLQQSKTALFQLDGYRSTFSCREVSNGGLAVYIRNDIESEVVEVETRDGLHYILVNLHYRGRRLALHAVYRPPGFRFTDFVDVLDQKLANTQKGCDVILVGDTNVPVNLGSNNAVREFLRLLSSHDTSVTNTFATRPVTNNILDHVICSSALTRAMINETIETTLSDHSIVLSSFNLAFEREKVTLTKKIVDHERLNSRFLEAVQTMRVDASANDKIAFLMNQFNEIRNSVTKTVTVEAKLKGHCPWMTLELWKLIKIKENVLKNSKRHPHDDNLKAMLKHVSRKLNIKKSQCKRNYYQNMLQNSSIKQSWRVINDVLGRKRGNDRICLENNHSDLGISNAFNDFFCSVGHDLASSINSDRNITKFGTLTNHSSSIFLQPATHQEIILLIRDLDVNKAPGPDNITASFVKTHHLVFTSILKDVFDEMISTGQYPECLKTARVVPLHKSGDRLNINNYRPISTLSVLNKILEKLLATRIMNFLESSKLIYTHQYGFRRGCSTFTAASELVDQVYGAIDHKQISGVLFLDLKKAFDTIDHNLLLQKISYYGLRGIPLTLLESYLSNRRQFVSVNGVNSEPREISIGVPQGSVLGPLLFLVYINDLSRLRLHGSIRFFADDSAILYNHEQETTVATYIQQDLVKLQDFFNTNMLSLNLKKTTFMLFHSNRRNVLNIGPLYVNEVCIDRTTCYKYLGLTLDETLSWDAHIEELKHKLTPICGVLRKISSFVPVNWLNKLYFALVHSRLHFLVGVWGNASKSRLRELQCIQNRCMKAVLKKPHLYPTVSLFNDVNNSALPIRALYEFQIIVQMHRILCDDENIHNNLVFDRAFVGRSSRQANNLRLARPTTESGKKRFSYAASKLYNELPLNIKQSPSVLCFKRNLRLHLKNNINRYLQ